MELYWAEGFSSIINIDGESKQNGIEDLRKYSLKNGGSFISQASVQPRINASVKLHKIN